MVKGAPPEVCSRDGSFQTEENLNSNPYSLRDPRWSVSATLTSIDRSLSAGVTHVRLRRARILSGVLITKGRGMVTR